MTAAEAAAWVEIIKAIGTALGVVLAAAGLAYGRIAAKQSKKAVAQTATDQYVDGKLRSKPTAVTAEQALEEARTARQQIDALLERERLRGAGVRRADTTPQPDLSTVQPPAAPPSTQADTAMFARLNPPSDAL